MVATTTTELSNIFTANDARVRTVLKELHDKVADVGAMRALGFCVSVAHAEYMARKFVEAGIPARALSGGTPPWNARHPCRPPRRINQGSVRCRRAE